MKKIVYLLILITVLVYGCKHNPIPVSERKGKNIYLMYSEDIIEVWCIDGYRFAVSRTVKGNGITQMYKITLKYPDPMRCE